MKKILLSSLLMTFIGFNAFGQSQLISFEASEGYNLGDINNQQGWEYWGGLDSNTGTVTTSAATNGTRSVNFISNGYMDEAGMEKTITGYNQTQYSFDYKIEDIDGSDYTMAVWDSSYEAVGAFVINYAQGNVRILDADNSTGLVNTTLNITPGVWYNFKMVVNMTAKTVEYFVNNISYGVKAVNPIATGFNIIDFYYDDFGSGFTVDNIKIEDASLLSTNEILTKDSFSISPNPTANFVNIKTDSKINYVEVLDLSGKKVFNDLSGKNQIDISSLTSGNYILKVNTSKGILTKKIIKK